MSATRSARTLSDRTLNRLIIAALLILAIGVPAMIAFYWFDRHVDAGPSLISREITAAEDAVRQNPNLLSARLALAYDYLAAQQYTDAVSQFNEALKADAGNKSALMGRGKAYFSSAQLDLALPDFQQVVDAAKGTDLETSDPQVEEALTAYGEIVGSAFQLSDDILDIASDSGESGKTPGTDLREGVPTLPVLMARASGDPADARLHALLDGDLTEDDRHAEALRLLRAHPALGQARDYVVARAHEAKAHLAVVPPGPVRDALEAFAALVAVRSS